MIDSSASTDVIISNHGPI